MKYVLKQENKIISTITILNEFFVVFVSPLGPTWIAVYPIFNKFEIVQYLGFSWRQKVGNSSVR